MEEIKNMLRSLQEDIKQQKEEMLKIKEDIKCTINSNINEKFKILETKNQKIETKLENQKIKIDNFEKFSRRKNIVIFGIEEDEKNYQELEEKVSNFFNDTLDICCEKNCIEVVRRIGRKSEKSRPILVSLLTIGLKIKIMQSKRKLIGTPFYIKEDYPKEVLEKRRELQTELTKARDQGVNAILKYDKIIILNDKQKDPQNTNKKRNLSESPENNTHLTSPEKQKQKQPAKINKTCKMDHFLLKKITSIPPQSHCSKYTTQ